MSRNREPTEAYRSYITNVLIETAKKAGTSYRYLPTTKDAEKVRQQVQYLMKTDETFDWTGYMVGRKKNQTTNKIAVWITNDEKKLPPEMQGGDPFTTKKLEATVGYAVRILCDKKYKGIVALPKMRSYKETQKYLERKCEERLGYPVDIVIERDPDTHGYHAKIFRKKEINNE